MAIRAIFPRKRIIEDLCSTSQTGLTGSVLTEVLFYGEQVVIILTIRGVPLFTYAMREQLVLFL